MYDENKNKNENKKEKITGMKNIYTHNRHFSFFLLLFFFFICYFTRSIYVHFLVTCKFSFFLFFLTNNHYSFFHMQYNLTNVIGLFTFKFFI